MQDKVKEFHLKHGLTVNDKPTVPSDEDIYLALGLIQEEFDEVENATINPWSDTKYDIDLVEVADALGDLLYVTFGVAIRFGINLEPIFDEIHRSNMTKPVGEKEDGKVVKGEGFEPPALGEIIDFQTCTHKETYFNTYAGKMACSHCQELIK